MMANFPTHLVLSNFEENFHSKTHKKLKYGEMAPHLVESQIVTFNLWMDIHFLHINVVEAVCNTCYNAQNTCISLKVYNFDFS